MDKLMLDRHEMEHIKGYLRMCALPYLARLRYDAARNINTRDSVTHYTSMITHIQDLERKLDKIITQERERESGAICATMPVCREDGETLAAYRGRIFDEPPTHISEHLFDETDREE